MRRITMLLLVAAAALAVSAASGSDATVRSRWVIRDLGTLGGPESRAEALNERGQVVGWSDTAEKDGKGRFVRHAFLWERGRMRDLGALGSHEGFERSEATALNERGQVVGWSTTPSSARHAFVWERGRMRDLGSLSAELTVTEATAVNESGLVIGQAEDPEGPYPEGHAGAFVWKAGRMRALPPVSQAVALNDRGEVLVDALVSELLWKDGQIRLLLAFDVDTSLVDLNERGEVAATLSAYGMGVPRAAIWAEGKLRRLGRIGPRGCEAWDLDDRGQVAGLCRDRRRRDQPVVWKSGQPTRIPVVWGDRGVALALNDRGQVVGWTSPRGPGCHAFVWESGRTTDLGVLAGGRCAIATALDDRGLIVDHGTTGDGRTHAVAWMPRDA